MPGRRVVILNPFDPLLGEEQGEGRYAYLARRLCENGFDVAWITSDWSHRYKRRRDREDLVRQGASRGVQVEFVGTMPYKTNIALRRLRSHAAFSKAAVQVLETQDPNVVVVSTPPPQLADGAVLAAHRMGAAAIVDVQDLWPEEFRRFWPAGLKWMNDLAFARMRSAYRRACREADARVGVAEAYLADARRFGRTLHDLVVHLGVDVEAFDRAAGSGTSLVDAEGDRPARALFWGGTISSATDWPRVVDAVARLVPRHPSIMLIVLGTGPDAAAMQQRARAGGLGEHVRFLGFQPYEAYVSTLCRADITIHALHPTSAAAFPNRAFDYLAAGKPIVNSVGGEFGKLVETEGIGLNVPAGSAEAMADAFARLLDDADLRREMGRRARRLAEQRFDRRLAYEPYIRLCRHLAG